MFYSPLLLYNFLCNSNDVHAVFCKTRQIELQTVTQPKN